MLRETFAPGEFAISGGVIEIYRPAEELGRVTMAFAGAGVPLISVTADEGDREAALVALM